MIGGIRLHAKKEKTQRSKMSPDAKAGLSNPGGNGSNIEIRVKGQLSVIWADWFEGLTIKRQGEGEMILTGYIVDQAALMGVLNKLNRLNLTLLSLNEIKKS